MRPVVRSFPKESVLRVLGTLIFPIAVIAFAAPAVSDPLPESGTAKFAAYQVCRSLSALDMGPAGSRSATECTGIVRNLEAQKQPDNLAIRCLEDTYARPEAYKYSGACVETDSDGDKLFITYEGSKAGKLEWVGGTGKFKDVTGSGDLGVVVAPGGTATGFAYTLTFDVSWSHKK
jgi:hypothetical protein